VVLSFHHQFQILFIELHLDQCFKCICSFSLYKVSSGAYLIMEFSSAVIISSCRYYPRTKINLWFTYQMVITEENYIFLNSTFNAVTTCFYCVINVMIILKQLLQLKCIFYCMWSVHGGDVCDTLLVGTSFTMLWFFVFGMLFSMAVWWWDGSLCSSTCRIPVIWETASSFQ
jgi:hypothetical protein